MTLEKHRKPDGNYDGVGVMAEVTGLARDEIRAIAEQVKANHARLEGCPWHEFEVIPQPGITARLSDRYRCRHCQGEVDAVAYRWHQKGRRPMPVGEPQPVRKVGVGYPCQGGPLDGKMLAYDDGSTYRVVRQPPPPSVQCASPPPKRLECTFGEYRLKQVGPDQLAWVFQGWLE